MNMNKFIKYRKTLKEIQKKLINILQYKIHLPQHKKYFFYITHIEISKNYTHVNIYLTFHNIKNKDDIQQYINIIKKKTYIITKKLIQETNLKYIPKIYFLYDQQYNQIQNLFKLIQNIHKK